MTQKLLVYQSLWAMEQRRPDGFVEFHFSIGDPSQAGTLRWNPKKRQLSLALTEEGLGLFGEVAQALAEAVAKRLQATTQPSYATIAELDGPKKP